jgi:hypothetical protein
MHLPTLELTRTLFWLLPALVAPPDHSILMQGEYLGPIVKGQPTTG